MCAYGLGKRRLKLKSEQRQRIGFGKIFSASSSTTMFCLCVLGWLLHVCFCASPIAQRWMQLCRTHSLLPQLPNPNPHRR